MTYLNEARNHLAKGRLDASIEILKENVQDPDLKNEVYYLESRYNKLQNKVHKGIIEDEDAILEENRITNSVLILISNLADPNRAKAKSNVVAPTTGSGGGRFDFRWVLIGLLLLVIVLGGIYIFTLDNGNATVPAPTDPVAESIVPTEPASPATAESPPPATPSTPTRRDPNTGTRSEPARAEPSETTPPPPPREETAAAPTPAPAATEPTDPCAGISCLNGGRCLNGQCDCPPGYSGDRCQTRTRLSNEDCLRFNAGNLRILEEGGSFILSDGSRRMISFPNREEATQTMSLIRHYDLAGGCFAQRPNPALQYFVTSSFELPRGSFPGEDCLRIRDAQALKARSYNENSWILADGSSVLFQTKSKAETDRIQAVMRHYDPGFICYVGRPKPSVVYLRK